MIFQEFGFGANPVTKRFKNLLYTNTIRLLPLTWFHLPCIRLAFLGEQWSKYATVEPAAFEVVYYKLSSYTKPLGRTPACQKNYSYLLAKSEIAECTFF